MIISNKKINNIYFAIFVVLFSFTLISFSLPNNTKAVSASNWNPGRIIDDAVFFNSNSMSPGQIQNFLNAKVPVCDTNNPFKGWIGGVYNSAPYTCLKDYNEGGKGSAQIIWEAGQTHGINPQVLIIMLQKESALVTDTWAAPWQYKSAMGYGCPDTAECDSKYYGFSNQVNNAAWQLRAYVNNPNGYNFRSGVTRNIQWSPNGACGSSPVFIQNSATAALYNYTPYQPNQAALNNLYGIGDGCSAYGNRNFWRMFNDWFGSTSGQGYEFVDAINPPNQVLPNDVVGATIRIRNRSGVTWYSDGNVPAGQHAMRLASLSYLNTPYANTADPAWLGTQNQIRMKEQTVADGGIATFEFTFRSPMHQVTTYWTQFAPVFDGSYFMPYIGLSFITSTPTPNYSYRLETATGIPTSISANSAQPASYLLRNTGNVVWWGETNRMIGAAPTRLFTINPYYHPSAFYDPGTWLANNQVKLQADRIDPGAAGLFSFILKSPSESNTYSESFGLILDGRTPYPTDNQMSFNTYVGDYSYSLVNSNLPSSLIPGQKYDCVITIKNTGAATWYSDGNTPSGSSPVRLITAGYSPHPLHNQSDSGWLTSSQIRMYNSSVAPNQNAEFRFSFIAPYNTRDVLSNLRIAVDGKVILPGDIRKNTAIPVLNPSYQHVPAGIHPSPVPLVKGQISNGKLILKNTSNFIWYNEDAKPQQFRGGATRLVMSSPYYRTSPFNDINSQSWLGTTNQIKMTTPVVSPGENAEFDYSWKAPNYNGKFKERFSLVLDGNLLFTDIGMQIDTTVQ